MPGVQPTTAPSKQRTPSPHKTHKKIPIKQVIALKNGGMNQVEIAEVVGCSRQNISAILARYGITKDAADEFEQYQVDILKGKLGRVIQNIDETRLSKGSVNNLAYAAKQLHEIYRLASGQSTANVAQAHTVDGPLRDLIGHIMGHNDRGE